MPQLQTQAPAQQPPNARQLNGHPNIPQGGLFNLPGITYWSEQVENNDQTVVTALAGTQVAAQFQASLTNTDILYREIIDVSIVSTNEALAGGTVFKSPYVPYNYVGPIQLSMQNQFNSYDVPSGADAAIFTLIRPQYYQTPPNYIEANPVEPIDGAQALLGVAPITSNARSTPTFGTTTAYKFTIDMPVGMWFDRYFDLEPDGSLVNLAPVRSFVTPQLMSGSNRVITPRVTMNPIIAANIDAGPWVQNTGTSTVTGGDAVTLGWQRKVVYQPKAHTDTPILWGWQYSRETKQYSLSGRSAADIVLPTTGQLLCVYYRLVTPGAASGGATIALSNVTNVWLQYGSGLYKFQDTALRCQRRFMRQHTGLLPFEGVLIHDMVIDEMGHFSNQNALNTLDTSSCKVHFDFTGAQGTTAVVYIGVEALRYVVQQ